MINFTVPYLQNIYCFVNFLIFLATISLSAFFRVVFEPVKNNVEFTSTIVLWDMKGVLFSLPLNIEVGRLKVGSYGYNLLPVLLKGL